MRKKEILIFVIIIATVISIIFLIKYVRGNGNHNEELMRCIAQNSKIIVSPTCGACAYQKEILNDYLNLFEIININQEIGNQYNLKGVPTWIINEQTYAGVRSVEQLKELTGC